MIILINSRDVLKRPTVAHFTVVGSLASIIMHFAKKPAISALVVFKTIFYLRHLLVP